MKPIIHVKTGILSAALVFPFILSLAGFTVWCHYHFGRPTTVETVVLCGIWLASLYFPIDAIYQVTSHPSSWPSR